jgi:hypothetical protein
LNGWNDLNPAMLPHSGRMRLPSSTGEAFPMETGEKCVVWGLALNLDFIAFNFPQ